MVILTKRIVNTGTKNGRSGGNGRRIATQQSLDAKIWSICNILRRSNCAGVLQYVPELTWILFLRILDEQEREEADEADAVGEDYYPSIENRYRWQDWAAPGGYKRIELGMGALGAFFGFVNGELLPYLRGLRDRPNATPRQIVVSEVMSGVERVRVDTEKNFLDVLDRVQDIRVEQIDDTHIFPLSQIYEGLLLRLGEKSNDGGQFFTPREIIRTMVKVVDPGPGETVYDPCCGTGGFLAQTYEYVRAALDSTESTSEQLETLKLGTFFGREKENLIYPICLANLTLHGIDRPNIWHGNTLTGGESYGGLFTDAPSLFDVVLTNPPFGGKEGREAQTNFVYKTSATQVLFLQHVMDKIKNGGRCGIVLDEGVLFRTNEIAYVQTKRKLLDEFNLYCIVSLPGGTFSAAGAGVKTNLLFFTKGPRTERVWYYDISDLKVGKTTPFTIDKLDDFFRLLPKRADSERSWSVPRAEIIAKNYDLKAVNPNRKDDEDTRTPEELLDLIEAKGREVAEALAELRRIGGRG